MIYMCEVISVSIFFSFAPKYKEKEEKTETRWFYFTQRLSSAITFVKRILLFYKYFTLRINSNCVM